MERYFLIKIDRMGKVKQVLQACGDSSFFGKNLVITNEKRHSFRQCFLFHVLRE
jgi:hypothetical protein